MNFFKINSVFLRCPIVMFQLIKYHMLNHMPNAVLGCVTLRYTYGKGTGKKGTYLLHVKASIKEKGSSFKVLELFYNS